MKEVIADIDQWLQAGESIALATVVQTWGSAPRRPGAKMALTADGQICGSVSGGCVEGAVVEAGQQSLTTGEAQLLHFGVADETAWEVGLACGGTIEVFVEPLDEAVYAFMRGLIRQDSGGAAITVIQGPAEMLGRTLAANRHGVAVGTLGDAALDAAATAVAAQARQPRRQPLAKGIEVFVDVQRPSPQLVVVGGVHTAIPLTNMAQQLGYRTVVVDPRRAFGSEARFPHVDQLIQAWPQKAFAEVTLTEETAVALLTHDPKIDDPALQIILAQPVFYVGALGSRRTHEKRKARLREYGLSETQIDRIHGPIGLDIGATTPEEIAVSVLAEIVRARNAADPA